MTNTNQVRDRDTTRALMGYPRLVTPTIEAIDEMCTCGVERSEHADRYGIGHGSCQLTDCKQFTWAGFILGDGSITP